MRRGVLASVVVSVSLLLLIAAPAAAKLPPFAATVHVEGNVATVTIVLDGYDPEVPVLGELLALYPADSLAPDGSARGHRKDRHDMDRCLHI